MIGTVLETEDLARLLGVASPEDIARTLRGQGIAFKTGADGKPYTTLDALNFALGLEVLLKLPEVRERTGKSTATIYRDMAAGTFPLALKRGRQSLWVASEVQAVIEREVATLPRMGRNVGARPAGKKKATDSLA